MKVIPRTGDAGRLGPQRNDKDGLTNRGGVAISRRKLLEGNGRLYAVWTKDKMMMKFAGTPYSHAIQEPSDGQEDSREIVGPDEKCPGKEEQRSEHATTSSR